MISDQFLCIPIPRIADNHSSFINVPHRMIISGLGDTLPNDKVVIEILEDAIPDDELFPRGQGTSRQWLSAGT